MDLVPLSLIPRMANYHGMANWPYHAILIHLKTDIVVSEAGNSTGTCKSIRAFQTNYHPEELYSSIRVDATGLSVNTFLPPTKNPLPFQPNLIDMVRSGASKLRFGRYNTDLTHRYADLYTLIIVAIYRNLKAGAFCTTTPIWLVVLWDMAKKARNLLGKNDMKLQIFRGNGGLSTRAKQVCCDSVYICTPRPN